MPDPDDDRRHDRGFEHRWERLEDIEPEPRHRHPLSIWWAVAVLVAALLVIGYAVLAQVAGA